jgi:predicted outer membrane repeat protein
MFLTGNSVVTMGSNVVIADNKADTSGAAIHVTAGNVTFGRCV